MSTVSHNPPACNYHLEAIDYRGGAERSVCCEAAGDVAAWLRDNGFTWTSRGFYRIGTSPHEKTLAVRVRRGDCYGAIMSLTEQAALFLRPFHATAATLDV